MWGSYSNFLKRDSSLRAAVSASSAVEGEDDAGNMTPPLKFMIIKSVMTASSVQRPGMNSWCHEFHAESISCERMRQSQKYAALFKEISRTHISIFFSAGH